MTELNPFVCCLWGDEKTCKTSTSLSWPKPLIHLDIDVGGFDRAIWRIDKAGITSESFPTPMQAEKMLGLTKLSGLSIDIHKKVDGMLEAWQKIIMCFLKAVQDPKVKTIVFDTWTMAWTVSHRSVLQEIQEKQMAKGVVVSEVRESLMSKDYGPANDRMTGIIQTARAYKKNLVLVHYPREIYATRIGKNGPEEYNTGKQEPDGFKHTTKLADIVIRTDLKETRDIKAGKVSYQPQGQVTLCGLNGLGMDAVGMYLPECSYSGIVMLRELMSGG